MNTEWIHSQAPTRLDLAGGTLDIWPLYLFLKDPLTLNLSINLFAQTLLEVRPMPSSLEPDFQIISQDQGVRLEGSWEHYQEQKLQIPQALQLPMRLLDFFYQHQRLKNPPTQIKLMTSAQSPAGAGLGGSSALAISLVGALAQWSDYFKVPQIPETSLIELTRDIETIILKVPAGLQDYYSAFWGGLQALHWKPGSHQRFCFPEACLEELQSRLLLFYTGQSHHSGLSNWAVFKQWIETPSTIQPTFEHINQAAHQLKQALLEHHWTQVGQALDQEWNMRKTLAVGLMPETMELFFQALHQKAPLSIKVCGAGAGGCFFLYSPDPTAFNSMQSNIFKLCRQYHIQPIDFKVTPTGLQVKRSQKPLKLTPSSIL